jgi:transcriptional regulator with XRE-family HTH domain
MISLEELGSEIAKTRKSTHLRQADLALRAGVSRATLDALENGRAPDIGFSRLARILATLGLELRLAPAATRRPTLEDLMAERAGHDEFGQDESEHDEPGHDKAGHDARSGHD